jgi:hypothetical protein
MKLLKSLTTLLILIFSTSILYSQGFLHANGKYLYDGSGNEVILRGIGTGNWMIQEGYMMQSSDVAGTQHEFRDKLINTIGVANTDSFYNAWLDSHFQRVDVDSMKSWGFNSVRVAMHYKWFTPPIEDEPVLGQITWLNKGFTMIDSLLDWCGDNQMYLILDLHGAPGGQGKDAAISDYDSSKPSLWESQANKDKTVALWRKLAERYSAEPWIGGYDLINETNWTFTEANNKPLWDLFKAITVAIREVDNNHMIILEGNGFANDYSGLPTIWDSNMALSFHKYWTYNTQESISFATNLRNARNVPIWLGESGENSNVWFTSLIALCETNHIGWSWWPVKKPGLNNPLKVSVNSDYTNLLNYWKGNAANPGAAAAFSAVLQFAENHRLENCSYQKDVVDAMIRQTQTFETIPYTLFHTGEPIFAADYNLGRSGYAYYDLDSANFRLNTGVFTNWNQGGSYRNDGVDIQVCTDASANNGYNVGWTGNGEWMEYTVVVDSTASYTLSIRSASGSSGSKVRLEVDKSSITPVISLPGTGGWQNFQTTNLTGVILSKGTNKIRFKFDQAGSNLNYFMFSNPVNIESVPFKFLYAETSVDGNSITLTLNKLVTSDIKDVNLTDFSVLINNVPVSVNEVALVEGSDNKIVLSLAETLYYGGTIKLAYQSATILTGSEPLTQFTNASVANKLPVRYNLPSKIESENFFNNNGLALEACEDTGLGFDMGYSNAGDYLDYLVYVPTSRYYAFNFRVATTNASSQLTIKAGEGSTFTDVGTLTITSSGGWQTWKTVPITVYLEAGRYTLRMYVKSGAFNTNWFQVVYGTGVGINDEESSDLEIYPNPASDFVIVDLGGLIADEHEITIFNALGQPVKRAIAKSESSINISTLDLPKGWYYVVVKGDNRLLTSKLLIK